MIKNNNSNLANNQMVISSCIKTITHSGPPEQMEKENLLIMLLFKMMETSFSTSTRVFHFGQQILKEDEIDIIINKFLEFYKNF